MRPQFLKGDALVSGVRRQRAHGVTAAAVLALVLLVALVAAASASAATGSGNTKAVAPAAPAALSPALSVIQQTAAVTTAPQNKGAVTTIFSDGLEGGMSRWKLLGNPGWAATTYRSAAGSSSAYCAGSSITPPGPYANNMSAWMIVGPFDLSSITSGTFSFKMFCNTEPNNDRISAYVSLNGEDFSGTSFWGNYGGWVAESIDLANVYSLGNVCGKSQVWFAFAFHSDPAVVYEGAYIDEVSITGSGGGSGVREVGLILAADAEVVPYNGSVGLIGAILDLTAESLLPNKEVGLVYSQEEKIDAEWSLALATTSSTGEYSMTASGIKRLTYFSLVFAGDAQYAQNMMWPPIKVDARAKITPPAVPSTVRARVLYTSWGTIKPPHTAAQNRASHTKVIAEHYLGGKWRSVLTIYANKYKNTSSETKYAITLRYAPGKWRVRAVHDDDDHAKSTSSWRTFTAR